MFVQYVQLAFDLHRETIDGIFHFKGRIDIKVAESTAQIGRAAHLPKQPIHTLRFRDQILGQKCPKAFRQIKQYRCRFENMQIGRLRGIDQGWNF